MPTETVARTTTTIDAEQLRQAAAMLRTPTASWHRAEMAAVLEQAAERGARKVRKPRKAKPFDPFTEGQRAKFLKIKYPSRAHLRPQGDWPVRLEHNGTIIEDGKIAAAYLKQTREPVAA
jgi:hypothetical protein